MKSQAPSNCKIHLIPSTKSRPAFILQFILVVILLVIQAVAPVLAQTQAEIYDTVTKVLGDNDDFEGLDFTGLYNDRINRGQLNLLNFGAIPDDNAVDNKQAIINAVNTALSQNCREILVPGMFYSSEVELSNVSGIAFIGSGAQSGFKSKLTYNILTREAIFKLVNCANIEFRNLRFELDASLQTINTPCPIWIDGSNGNSENFRIINCTFVDCGPILIEHQNVAPDAVTIGNMRIDNCNFYPAGGGGNKSSIYIGSMVKDMVISSCFYYGGGQGDHFLNNTYGKDLQIKNCYLENSVGAAIICESGPVNIFGCTVVQAGREGIRLIDNNVAATSVRHSRIVNNLLQGAGRATGAAARAILAEGDDLIIASNLIYSLVDPDDDGQTSPMNGLELTGKRITVQNNHFLGFNEQVPLTPGGTAIKLTDGAKNVVIQGNRLYEWQTAIASENFDDLVVKNNSIADLSGAALHTLSGFSSNNLYILSNNINNVDQGWWIEGTVTNVFVQHNIGINISNGLSDFTNAAGILMVHNDHDLDGDDPDFKPFIFTEFAVNGSDSIDKIELTNNGNTLVFHVGGETYELNQSP